MVTSARRAAPPSFLAALGMTMVCYARSGTAYARLAARSLSPTRDLTIVSSMANVHRDHA